jgi:drug/metabolite transporter (DMT)-like permease
MKISRAYVYLHIAVLLFGFTGILGRLIELPSASMVWYRMAITLLSLFLFPKIFQKIKTIPRKDVIRILGVGVLVAIHWVTFFGAIKLSNVSITLSCMASAAFFTSLIEPLILKRPYRAYESILGGLVILGFVFIFSFTGKEMYLGIAVAILSALLAAIFGTFNKGLVAKYDVFAITAIEFIAGVAILTIGLGIYLQFVPDLMIIPTPMDWVWLLILALACTTLAFTLTMFSLKDISAFSAALAINLEPVYAIIMAYFFFREDKELNNGFYLGALIIVGAVFINPFVEGRLGRRRIRKLEKLGNRKE